MTDWTVRFERAKGSHHKHWQVRYNGKVVAIYRKDHWQSAIDHVMLAHRKFGI